VWVLAAGTPHLGLWIAERSCNERPARITTARSPPCVRYSQRFGRTAAVPEAQMAAGGLARPGRDRPVARCPSELRRCSSHEGHAGLLQARGRASRTLVGHAQLTATVREIDLLAYAATYLPESYPTLVDVMRDKRASGNRIRIALGDPTSPGLEERAAEVRIGEGIFPARVSLWRITNHSAERLAFNCATQEQGCARRRGHIHTAARAA
jgi:hypothetical protein